MKITMSDDLAYNVMFVGTSFMGIYNVGSAQCLLDHGKGVVHRIKCVGGTSAGAIAACLMVCAPERLLDYKDTIYQLSHHIHGLEQGACTEGYDIIAHLRSILDEYLKPDAHVTCSGRVCVPLTELIPMTLEPVPKAHKKYSSEDLSPRGSPRGAPSTVEMGGKTWTFGSRSVVSKFQTREELIEVLLASTYVPWFTHWKPPTYKNRVYEYDCFSKLNVNVDDYSLKNFNSHDESKRMLKQRSVSVGVCVWIAKTYYRPINFVCYWVDGSIGKTVVGVEDLDFPPGRLITVAPDKKAAHQKPQDSLTTQWRDISKESFQLQPFNMFRVGKALYPPPEMQLRQLFRDGVEDAKTFLQRFKVYEQGMDSLRTEGPLT